MTKTAIKAENEHKQNIDKVKPCAYAYVYAKYAYVVYDK